VHDDWRPVGPAPQARAAVQRAVFWTPHYPYAARGGVVADASSDTIRKRWEKAKPGRR